MPDKEYETSVFIFRRDLRLDDNIGLIEACKQSDTVIPIFIFTPEQLENNDYKSDNCVQFMMDSLDDLDNSLKKKNSRLFYFYGKPIDVIKKLIKNLNVDAVFVNQDYTPYSIKRDEEIKNECIENEIAFQSYEDILLNPIGSIKTGGDKIYTKFTPYFNRAKIISVDKPKKNNYKNFFKKSNKIKNEFKGDKAKFYVYNPKILTKGGRNEGLKILKNIKEWDDYNNKRNYLTYETTQLSAFNKFGCVSIREVYHAIKKSLGLKNDLIKQLYWRDFYYNIAWEYPKIFNKNNSSMNDKYNKIKWTGSKSNFNKWKEGMTGYPVVDACMRQMNTTGFMHNRGRLIVAGFLVKTLLISWMDGEKYFAQTLIDYDPSVNDGNWQWVSGSGADSQPYFRVFNPWLQSEKYDPKAEFIKKWIPELSDVDPKHIHNWYEYYDDYKDGEYPKPIVDYKEMKDLAIKMYKKGLY